MRSDSTLKLNHVIIVNIEGINGQGVGFGFVGNHKIFVDYTAPGDVVRARITHLSSKFIKADIDQILTSSTQRQTAPCPHFGSCGGCQLQHLSALHYTALKEEWVRTAVARAGFSTESIYPLVHVGPFARRRVVFKLHFEDGVLQFGFFKEASHELVSISECHVVDPCILDTAFMLQKALSSIVSAQTITHLHISYHKEEKVIDVVLEAGSPLLDPDRLFILSGIDNLPYPTRCYWLDGTNLTLIQDHTISYHVGDAAVALPPQSFLQATPVAQQRMTEEILKAICKPSTVFDLYSGCGTFSFPLVAQGHHVIAIEGSAAMVQAIEQAIPALPKAQQQRIISKQRDLYHQPIKADELQSAHAVVINPPRNGATPQLKEIVLARISTIVMVSCSLQSFERDAKLLSEAGYRLIALTPIDQFYWTRHTECVAHFEL